MQILKKLHISGRLVWPVIEGGKGIGISDGEGADIIDIGAESTRPGATPINKDQEIARIKDSLCKIVKIAHKAKVATAIDSYKYEVIKFALDNGIDMVNDQKGLETDKKVELVRSFGVPVVVMDKLYLLI